MSLKKKIFASALLSTVVLSATLPSIKGTADTTSSLDNTIQSASNSASQAKAQQDSLQKQVDDANSQLKKLTDEQNQTTDQIVSLKAAIDDRQESLSAQARSAQMNGGATSYINTILNAKSITDAVQKITAMSEVVSANNKMMVQQQQDEKALQDKLASNQDAYKKATELQQSLAVQSAQLTEAQLNYQATIATAQDQKDALLAQKAEAAQNVQNVQNQQSAYTQGTQVQNSTGNTVTLGHSASNPYPAGQCTAFVWEYFGGNIPTYVGNAGNWVVYANAGGPAAGEIAVFPPGNQGAGGVGHVAVITGVNSDGTFNVIEGNFNGGWGTTRNNVSTAGVSFIRP